MALENSGEIAELSPLGRAALAYAVDLGWAVFPLRPGDKIPLLSKSEGGNGCLDATTDGEKIAAWWTKNPTANIAIATGEPSGIVIVDVDGPEGEAALVAFGELPQTPVSSTGKGRHIVFARPESGLRNSAKKLGPDLDVRGDGGYIVAPPSVHPSGARYTWDRAGGRHPSTCPVAELPANVLRRLTETAGPSLQLMPSGSVTAPAPRSAADIPTASIASGGRNQTLAEYAGRLLSHGMGELETLSLCHALNIAQCIPPLERVEVERTVTSIAAAERRQRQSRAADVLQSPPPALAEELQGSALVRIDRVVFDALEVRNEQPIDAMPTMLTTWNDACRGFGGGEGLARGWHVTVGGASGTGKSLVALNLAACAVRAGHRVAYLSLEMATDQLLSRLLAIYCARPVREMEPGRMYSPATYRQCVAQLDRDMEQTGAGLYIAERPSATVTALERQARSAVADGCRIVILDYVQLVEVPGTDGISEQTRRVSHMIQRVAFDGQVTTVGLSQFNRATSFNKDAPPTEHGLTGSSALENDSDQVVLLDHTVKTRNGHMMDTNLIVAKNRHGPLPKVPVRWDYSTLVLSERPEDMTERRTETATIHGIRTSRGVA